MFFSVISAIISFIGTNIDDILMLTLFFAQNKSIKNIVAGQYLGMGILTAVSIAGAYGLKLLPDEYIWCFGFVPVVLAIKEIPAFKKQKQKESTAKAPSNTVFLSVALMTVSGGADNIGVYVPLFANSTAIQAIVTIIIFMMMTAVWCFFGKNMAKLPILKSMLLKYRHIIIPIVFAAIGIYIILKNLI